MLEKLQTLLHDSDINNLDPKNCLSVLIKLNQTLKCSRPHTLDLSHGDEFHIRTRALTVEPTEMLITT